MIDYYNLFGLDKSKTTEEIALAIEQIIVSLQDSLVDESYNKHDEFDFNWGFGWEEEQEEEQNEKEKLIGMLLKAKKTAFASDLHRSIYDELLKANK